MPFFPNFAELKGLANTLNPLNVFAEPDGIDKTPKASPTVAVSANSGIASTGTAIAGPGPSTQAASAHTRTATLDIPSSASRPIRPSLKNGTTSSSSSSFDEDAGRRRSSGASVVIVDPIDDDAREKRRGIMRDESTIRRKPRPLSVGPGSFVSEGRKRRKAPLDTYIIVKPPPTSAKNPLNLQIQLVVKDTKARERSVSGVSVRTASTGTDITSLSAPVTPATPTIGLPPTDGSLQAGQSESSATTKLRSESPSPLFSEDADPTRDVGAALQRSSSLKSELSSATSGSTFSGGARKRVEPMFNLAVHNVMQPTVVTDAATDVKVAKFLKRTVDVAGVGVLEPAEVWLPPSNAPSSANLATHSSNEESRPSRSRPVSTVSLTVPLSPTATRGSEAGSNIRNSIDMSLKRTSLDLKNFRNEVGQDGAAKKFFGKMFKKKAPIEAQPSTVPRSSLSVAARRSPSPSAASNNNDGPNVVVKPPTATHPATGFDIVHSHGHATFGTAPVIVHRRSSGTIVTAEGAVTGLTASGPNPSPDLNSSPSHCLGLINATALPMLPSSRPVGYTWSVKKWAKKNSEGWAGHMIAAAAAGLELVNGGFNGEGEDEVIFEWVKLRVPSTAVGSSIMRQYSNTGAITAVTGNKALKGRKPRSRQASIRGDSPPSDAAVKSSLAVNTNEVTPLSLPPSPNPSIGIDPRPQPVRRLSATISPVRRSVSSPPSIAPSDEHDTSSLHTTDMTAEEDSDPEDNETPWTCSVWVKKTGQRQLLGTLTPAPHHPKVIAALKIPRSLDSVSLTESKPSSTPALAAMAARVKEEVCLTEENLKDVVCVTAMWLVAREEFGGLGRKKRHSKV